MFRAILEGIAYEYAEWARLAAEAGSGEPTEARVLGGGARSELWNQIKADVLGIDWVPTVRQECGVLGDALVAAAATGHVAVEKLAGVAKSWQETAEPVHPDPDRHRRYRELQATYRELAERAGPVFERLGQASR
jgi:xylulokinase